MLRRQPTAIKLTPEEIKDTLNINKEDENNKKSTSNFDQNLSSSNNTLAGSGGMQKSRYERLGIRTQESFSQDIGVRRSQRIRSTYEKQDHYSSDLSDVDRPSSDAEELSGSESEHSKADEEEEDDDDADADYGRSTNKRKSLSRKRRSQSQKINKKGKNNKRLKTAATIEEIEDFVENYLFQALSDPNISINELASNWLEEFEENKVLAMKDLINFLLRCCGCVSQVEEHDVVNNESAADTIAEVQQAFANQKVHEYPLMVTNAKWKNFKSNILQFVEEILIIANEKSILYNEDESFMENLLIWLGSLSTSNLRPLRYCSTLFLLNMETTLCKIVVKASVLFEKNNRQLEIENAKREELKLKKTASRVAREQNKLEKDINKIDRRITQISSNVQIYKQQKLNVEEFLKDISNTTFVHRYRDVDPKIRQECISSLGEWIDIYPEFFFESSYLRYFGWILSDKNSLVRLEVLKSLAKLYRKGLIAPGFRQFTERFKKRLIEMCIYDSDYQVRLHAIMVIFEIGKIGFLEDEEILSVTALAFCDQNNKLNLTCNTNNKFNKLQHELIKFISLFEMEQTKEFKDNFNENILINEKAFGIDLNLMIKFKSLIDILAKSFDFFLAEYSNFEKKDSNKIEKFSRVSKLLYLLPQYYSPSLIEFIVKYLLFDLSSVELVDDAITSKVELSTSDSKILLNFAMGITAMHFHDDDDKDNDYLGTLLRSQQEKKKQSKELETANEKDFISNKLITHISQLLEFFKNDQDSLLVFLSVFEIIFKYNKRQQNSNNMSILYKLTDRILKIFRELDLKLYDKESKLQFIAFFKSIVGSNRVTVEDQDVRLMTQSLIAELISELHQYLKESSLSGTISQIGKTLNKLLIIASSINITQQLDDITKDDVSDMDVDGEFKSNIKDKSIIELICEKCLQNEDAKIDEMDSILIIFKFFSNYASWKLETLLNNRNHLLQNENNSFKISSFLSNIKFISESLRKVITDDDNSTVLRIEASKYLIDLLSSLKIFSIKITHTMQDFENDDKLADIKVFFDLDVPLALDENLLSSLMKLFLIKENDLAKHLHLQLDRDEEEDVNFESLEENDDEEEEIENQEESEELEQARIAKSAKKVKEAENSLCLFLLKLLILKNLDFLNKKMVKRISLNKEQLGGLFQKIIDDDLAKTTQQERRTTATNTSATVENEHASSSSNNNSSNNSRVSSSQSTPIRKSVIGNLNKDTGGVSAIQEEEENEEDDEEIERVVPNRNKEELPQSLADSPNTFHSGHSSGLDEEEEEEAEAEEEEDEDEEMDE
ncbi:hypothetical protein PACTADRAFT_4993 [Pachysolen tannophilus NRRL Y-2460]|uniref:SCD domain-containing protein n=1 Tax=Pachysolen tannophilus NRRL Y-2460 TaxID=669874 RepID=A0A1E4TNA7_PACTA|nr:hypothetical protein PACTADRAFT_4993 [Pachysolen tannophilus NRRL Y-2460]